MDDQVMKSVSVGDEGIYAAMHTSLLSYLRTDGKTGLGFLFHVLDFDKPEGDADRLKELHIAMNAGLPLVDPTGEARSLLLQAVRVIAVLSRTWERGQGGIRLSAIADKAGLAAVTPNGILGDPTTADPAHGAEVFETLAGELRDLARRRWG